MVEKRSNTYNQYSEVSSPDNVIQFPKNYERKETKNKNYDRSAKKVMGGLAVTAALLGSFSLKDRWDERPTTIDEDIAEVELTATTTHNLAQEDFNHQNGFELTSKDGKVAQVTLEEGYSIRTVPHRYTNPEDPTDKPDGTHSSLAVAGDNIPFNLTGDVWYNEKLEMVATDINNVLETADGLPTGISVEADEDGIVFIDANKADIEFIEVEE